MVKICDLSILTSYNTMFLSKKFCSLTWGEREETYTVKQLSDFYTC